MICRERLQQGGLCLEGKISNTSQWVDLRGSEQIQLLIFFFFLKILKIAASTDTNEVRKQ